jgi:hypothetical protein
MNTKKRIILILSDTPDYRELEWIMPYIAGFHFRGFEVDVLFHNKPNSERTEIMREWVKKYASCFYVDDFDSFTNRSSVISKIRKKSGILSKIVRPYTDFNHRYGKMIGLSQWRWRKLAVNLANWFDGASACFITNTSAEGLPLSAQRLTTSVAVSSNLPILWVHCGIGEVSPNKIAPHPNHVLLVFSSQQLIEAETSGRKALSLGAQRYNIEWLNEIERCFDNEFDFPPPKLPTDKKTVLVIMKNEYSPVWDGFNFEKETTKMFNDLVKQNCFMVVKPHPGQDIELLIKLLKKLPDDCYLLEHRPLAYWISKVDECFAQLSSGTLESFVLEKPCTIYDPIDRFKLGKTEKSELDLSPGEYVSTHLQSWMPKSTQSSSVGERESGGFETFRNRFCFDKSWPEALDSCEQFFLKGRM